MNKKLVDAIKNREVINALENNGWNKKSTDNLLAELKKCDVINSLQNSTLGEKLEILVASLFTGDNFETSYLNYIVQGQSDGGVDVIVMKDSKISFIQVKFKEYNDEYIRKMINIKNDYFSSKRIRSLPNDHKSLEKFINEFFTSTTKIKQFEYIFVGLNKVNNADVKNKFPNQIVHVYSLKEFILKAASGNLCNIIKTRLFQMEFAYKTSSISEDVVENQDEFFAMVNGENFLNQFASLQDFAIDQLFEKNIRNKVTDESFIKEIVKTIKNEPQHFHLFNNGITIVADELKIAQIKISITNPQVINGQQTLRTLISVYKNIDNKYDNEILENIRKILIPIRAVKVTDHDLITRIAKYSNNQKAVKSHELLYNGQNFKIIEQLASENGYKMDGKKGTKNSDFLVKNIVENGILELNELVRAHSSFKYPEEFLGESKNSISKVVHTYLSNDKYIEKLRYWKTFEKTISVIEEYKKFIKNAEILEKEKHKNSEKKSKEYKYLISERINPYKFGISVFYNRLFEESVLESERVVIDIYNNDANKNINLFKNNLSVNSALKNSLKRLGKNK